jgi:hypothetical protein
MRQVFSSTRFYTHIATCVYCHKCYELEPSDINLDTRMAKWNCPCGNHPHISLTFIQQIQESSGKWICVGFNRIF